MLSNLYKFFAVLALVVLAACSSTGNNSVTSSFNKGSGVQAYHIGSKLSGLHERRHTKSLRRHLGVNTRRTPWCGYFVAYAYKKAGLSVPKGFPRSLNWTKYGKPVKLKHARKGDIVVIRTSYGHHVAMFHGVKGGRVLLLGGNQSNQVKVSSFRIRSIRAIRRAS